MRADENVSVDLKDHERELLSSGLLEWGGPAHCTEELAIAMGFKSVRDLFEQGDRIRADLKRNVPLARLDWTRALAATEFVFASDVFGSGCDWSTTTGSSDEDTLRVLRGLQRKLIRAGAIVGAAQIGKQPPRGTGGRY